MFTSLVGLLKLKTVTAISTVIVVSVPAFIGITKGLDYYSFSRLEQEGLRLNEAGLHREASEKYALALSKWSPEEDKGRIIKELAEARGSWETEQQVAEIKRSNYSPVGSVAGDSTLVSNDNYSKTAPTLVVTATPTFTTTLLPTATPTIIIFPTSVPVSSTPTVVPTPTHVPTMFPLPTATPLPPIDEGKLKALGNIANSVTQISIQIYNLRGLITQDLNEKSKCFVNPDYAPLKVGISGHEILTKQCSDMYQESIDRISLRIATMEKELGEYDRQKNGLMSGCSYCPEFWDGLMKGIKNELKAKGYSF